LALLALWRYLGAEHKSIGPALLGALLGTTTETARVLLKRLLKKGYVGSAGKRAKKTGKAAERWLTDKIKWPVGGNSHSHPTPDRVGTGVPRGVGTGVPGKVGTGAPTDLGVRHTSARVSDASLTPVPTCNQSEEEKVCFADI